MPGLRVDIWWMHLDGSNADRMAKSRRIRRAVLASRYGVESEPSSSTGADRPPPLAHPAGTLYYSSSRSGSLGVLAVARLPVGVDLERRWPYRPSTAELRRICASGEARAIRFLPGPSQPDAMSALWTRKEAVLKAAGVGLAVTPVEVVTGFARPKRQLRQLGVTVRRVPASRGYQASVAVLALGTIALHHDWVDETD